MTELSSPLVTMAAAIGLLGVSLPSLPLNLSMMTVAQIVERLIKGTMVPVGKWKMVVAVAPSPLPELAKPPVKVSLGLVKAFIPDSCLDRELLAKHFC